MFTSVTNCFDRYLYTALHWHRLERGHWVMGKSYCLVLSRVGLGCMQCTYVYYPEQRSSSFDPSYPPCHTNFHPDFLPYILELQSTHTHLPSSISDNQSSAHQPLICTSLQALRISRLVSPVSFALPRIDSALYLAARLAAVMSLTFSTRRLVAHQGKPSSAPPSASSLVRSARFDVRDRQDGSRWQRFVSSFRGTAGRCDV